MPASATQGVHKKKEEERNHRSKI